MDITHGTSSAYSWHKCRCDVCVAAKRERDRDYYRRNAEAVKARTAAYHDANKPVVHERQREYRERNAEALAEQKRQYHRDNADKIRAKVARWKADHPDQVRVNSAKYRTAHKAELNAKALAHYYQQMAEHPERVRARRRAWVKTQNGILANRAARHKRRGAPYTPAALEWIASLVDPICAYCGRMATEIDHIVPVNRGGTGDKDNLVPACRRCNARKGDMTLAEFLVRKDR